MIQVLIVDDEVLAINYLKNMIDWKEQGFEIIGEATNGKKALEIYLEKKPQLVISDIKMPIMDGLELTKQITKNNDKTKVLLTTAYKDFEYAKEAIKYGVANYLIKHEINKASLTDELNKIKKDIDKEMQVEKIVRARFVKNIFEGNYHVGDIDESGRSVFGEKFILLVTRTDKSYFALNKNNDNTKSSFCLIDSLNEIPILINEKMKHITSLEISNDICVILLNVDEIYSELKLSQFIYEFIHVLQGNVKEMYQNTISAVATSYKTIDELADTFREASNAIRYTVFKGKESILWLDKLPITRPDKLLDLEDYHAHLMTFTSETDIEGVSHIVTELFEKLTTPYWNLSELRHVTMRLDRDLSKLREEYNIVHDEDKNIPFSVSEVRDYYIEKYKSYIEQISKLSKAQYSKPVQNVIEYIIKHYNQEIGLEDIGDEFGLNGIYLGQLFKKETDITFLKYLTNYRIEEAKKLLITGKYNVSEVSEMVGYKTAQYFSQIFYKAAGIKPQEYKKWGERKK